jgi:hypothetical protein
MPAYRCVERKEKVKLKEAGWWQEPPVLLRERLPVVEHAVLLLRHKHDKMD